ncbi:TRAP-T-associated universal stress protein TeaD [Peptococcaceae bacterium CEB3]|nr:TRAP-T-associated universal stress protein TeaD [Peptococcaceae bacterium CEB3]
MFKKILVPTDASENSRRALKTALELAKLFRAELELLFVSYIPESFWTYNVDYSFSLSPEQIEQGGEQALKATLEGIDASNVPLSQKQVKGHPATMIVAEVKKENIELIVMGSRGYGPITGSILGSVSQRVLQQAKCPVLIVK